MADLGRSLRFYQDVIGFHMIGRAASGRGFPSARLGSGESDQVLLELHEKPGAQPVPRRGRLGIYHFAVRLPARPDLGRFLRHATALGVHVGAADHAFSEATYLIDPDGMTVEVYCDRPRDQWPRGDGELPAVSDPLDSDGLMAAAGETTWAGLPAGTTIGHMHFYVGDIPAAEAFYHAALGFDKTIWTLPGALFVSAGGYHHHVGLNTWAAGSPWATDADAKLLYWELVVPDRGTVDAVAQRLREAGYGVSNADGELSAVDPWGITVRLISSSR